LQVEIAHLLKFVRDSGCVFIRNGQVYDAREAEKHINRKYNHFLNRIATAEEFIQWTATRTTVSGRAYTIRCGQREMPSAEWLQNELDAFRRGDSAQGHVAPE